MAVILTPHWYQLPPPDYYQHAACTDLKEDARFYDSNDSLGTHGNAICTIDCLMSNKNAILPLLTFPDLFRFAPDCIDAGTPIQPRDPSAPAVTCAYGLIENVSIRPPGYAFLCTRAPFTNIQAGNWIARLRIYDITWGSEPSIDNNLLNPVQLYMPAGTNGVYGGSMYEEDGRAAAWKGLYSTDFNNETMNIILTTCSTARDTSTQQAIIEQCRLNYRSIFGDLVGYGPSIPVLPSARDITPSLDVNCQYVYDIGDNTGCPLIDNMCKSAGMRGEWRYSLAPELTSADSRMNLLPQHLCQNIAFRQQTYGAPWVQPPNDPHPNNQYFAGMGMQPDKGYLVANTTQPQSSSAYVYRSCALQKFTSTPEYCCANDFADGDGQSIFNPSPLQPPIVPGALPSVHRSPLIGYNYDASGTPWYGSCFDRNGLTCSTQFRDITGENCGRLMQPHCAVNPDMSAPESWDITATNGSSECSKWLGRLLYGPGGRWVQFLTIAANRGQLPDITATQLSAGIIDDITTNFHKVFTMKSILDNNMSALAQQMEPVVFTLYYSYDLALHDGGVLLNQCSGYTIEQAVANPLLRKWCGCMLSPVSYESRYPNVSIACTPTCNSSEVIQYGAPCEGTLCVIDDLTISLIDSKAGGVSIVQVCQSCGQIYSSDTTTVKQTCDCKIGTTNITAIDSLLGTITVKEMCGKSGNGGKPAPDPDKTTIAKVVKSVEVTIETFPYIATATLVALAVLALIAFLVSKSGGTSSRHWAKGLGVGCAILAVIIVAFMIYSIVVRSI